MGNMPQEWNEGLIYMIPKTNGQLEELRNWRPITLLNVIYKILAKMIARRLQPYLSELIHDSQTGFIQERSIFDNIFLFWKWWLLLKCISKIWQCYFSILKKLMIEWTGISWREHCLGWVFQTYGYEE